MRENDRLIIGSFVLSSAVSFIWLVMLAIGYSAGIPGDIGSILIAVLQLDGVLFGFGATFFSFLLTRTEGVITKWGFAYATTAFVSFFMSILIGSVALLGGDRVGVAGKLLPISFTLTGTLTIIAFLVVVGSARNKKGAAGSV